MINLFYEDKHPGIVYSGSWARAYGTIYRGSAIQRTRMIGDSAQFKFKGTAISLIGAQGWDHGTFTVNLDGVETILDGYCCGPNGGVPQVVQFEADNMSPNIEHSITITNTDKGPYGSVLELDAFMVTPVPAMPYKALSRHVAMVLVLGVFALLLHFARRRVVGLATKTLHMLVPSSASPAIAIPSSPTTLPLHRAGTSVGKMAPDYTYHNVEAGSSSSSTQYVQNELSSEAVDDIAHHVSQRLHPVPEHYSRVEVVDVELDDRLLDQLAHRVARIVQRDPPPSYSTSTS